MIFQGPEDVTKYFFSFSILSPLLSIPPNNVRTLFFQKSENVASLLSRSVSLLPASLTTRRFTILAKFVSEFIWSRQQSPTISKSQFPPNLFSLKPERRDSRLISDFFLSLNKCFSRASVIDVLPDSLFPTIRLFFFSINSRLLIGPIFFIFIFSNIR